MTHVSLTCGLPLRKRLRLATLLGITASSLYIMLGSAIVTKIRKRSVEKQENVVVCEDYTVYKGNDRLLMTLTVSVSVLSLIQVVLDVILFQMSLKMLGDGWRKLVWILFLLDIVLWSSSLLCFVIIFTGSGLLLLVIFLGGTSIRTYILYLLHSLVHQLGKPTDSGESDLTA